MISIDPKVLGQIDAYMEALKAIEKVGQVFKAVDLHAKQREDGDSNNAEIADHLAKGGRDFVTLREEDTQRIAQAFADVVIKGMQETLNTIGKTTSRGKIITADKVARNISGAAYKAAGEEWLKEISRRIEEGDWLGEGGDLSPQYKAWKEKKYPGQKIGVATGQLLANVSPKTGNLKLRK